MRHKAKQVLLTAGAIVGTSLLAAAWVTYDGHAHVWMSDTLVGTKVVGERGEQIGKVEDVVVSPSKDGSYAVVSLGSWANMADRYCAMPWEVIRTKEADTTDEDSERSLVLTVDKELLRKAPSFEKRDWPDMSTVAWRREIDSFYDKRDVAQRERDAEKKDKEGENKEKDGGWRDQDVVEASSRKKVVTWRATELMDEEVVTSSGDKLGDVENVAIDTNGRFCYAVVSVGGFLGMGEKLVAVPWDALEFTFEGEKRTTGQTGQTGQTGERRETGDKDQKRIITLSSTKKMLESAPEYSNDEKDRERMCDKEWIASVYKHFSVQPYWDDEKKPAPVRPVGK